MEPPEGIMDCRDAAESEEVEKHSWSVNTHVIGISLIPTVYNIHPFTPSYTLSSPKIGGGPFSQ